MYYNSGRVRKRPQDIPMFSKYRILLLSLFIFCFSFGTAFSQKVVSEITINMEKLPQQNKNKMMGIDRIVEAYINQRDWAPDDYLYDLMIDIGIHFDKPDNVEFEDRYNAKVVVNNRSNMQYNDSRWKFPLDPGVQLMFSEQFDPFRSMIDYYIFMSLGYEFDKVKKFGGTQYFDQARRICQNARFSSLYYIGWEEREKWVERILEPENDHMRYLNYLYYTGEWLFYTEDDPENAKKYLLYGIKQLDKVSVDNLERFFKLNYYHYAEALAEFKEFTALSKLASLDPNESHSDQYERLLKQR